MHQHLIVCKHPQLGTMSSLTIRSESHQCCGFTTKGRSTNYSDLIPVTVDLSRGKTLVSVNSAVGEDNSAVMRSHSSYTFLRHRYETSQYLLSAIGRWLSPAYPQNHSSVNADNWRVSSVALHWLWQRSISGVNARIRVLHPLWLHRTGSRIVCYFVPQNRPKLTVV